MTALAEHWRVLQAHRQRIEALEEEVRELKEAKPGPSFTARAGETITIKCVIPNCEVCEARKP